jgi:hypothetical protein
VDARHPDRDARRQEGAALIRGSWKVEAVLCLGLFALSSAIGAQYVRTVIDAGGKPRFYQGEFGPAVLAACGHGYRNPDLSSLPNLKAFLDVQRDRFDCAELGAGVQTRALSPMQVAFRYQEMTIATTWRMTGVSWRGLAPLYGALFGLATLAAYGLFRTSLSRVTATLGAIALSGSTIQLIYLPHFRDYSKAPFLLGAGLALAWLVKYPLSGRALVAAGAAYGLLLGVGVGFRNDLLIAVPPFVAVVLFFTPGRVRDALPAKAGAIAACVFAIWVAMLPMRAIYAPGGGNSMQHVVALGLGDTFNADLGVTNDDLYSWGHAFTDEYAHAQISAHATRMWNAPAALALYGPEYDRSASQLLTTIVTNFPGDMLARVYASVLRTFEVPYNKTSRNPPTLVQDPEILRGYTVRERVLRSLGAIWPWAVVVVLGALTVTNLRLALCVALIAFYFAAYPVLQFNERHLFHLEVLGWWALLVAAEYAVLAVVGALRAWPAPLSPLRGARWQPRLRAAMVTWLVAIALLIGPLWAARRVQASSVHDLLSAYTALDKEALDRTGSDVADGWVRLAADVSPRDNDASGDAVRTIFLVSEFAAGACESLKFEMVVRYQSPPGGYDFTHTVQVRPPLAAGTRRIFLATYAHPKGSPVLEGAYRLAGLDLPRESAQCLSGLYRVRDVTGMPLVLDANLPPDWESVTPFHTIDGIESRAAVEPSPDIYTFPSDLPVGRRLVVSPLKALEAADIEQRSVTLETAGRWSVDGTGGVGGRGPFLYLAQMKPRTLKAGDVLLAQGRLARGGFSLGLVQAGQWIAQVPVLTEGDFIVAIRVPADGDYAVVLANNLPGRSLHNELTIDRIGWLNGA